MHLSSIAQMGEAGKNRTLSLARGIAPCYGEEHALNMVKIGQSHW
jgi:hypothetical protein